MPATLTVRDETFDGRPAHEWSLDVLTERITVRELIRSRVYQEVQDYNLARPNVFRGLVQPSGEERLLNGEKRAFKSIDWKRQFELACEAFEANRVLILIGDVQVASLDEEIDVRAGTAVTFLRLTWLVGG